jgi:hypothetical protein
MQTVRRMITVGVSGEHALRIIRQTFRKSSAVISATNLQTEFGSKKASLLGGERCQEKPQRYSRSSPY